MAYDALKDAEVTECIVGVIRASGAPMSIDNLRIALTGFADEDQFLRCIRIATGNGTLAFNVNALLVVPPPRKPAPFVFPPDMDTAVAEQPNIFLTMSVADAKEMVVSELRAILCNNIKTRALQDPATMTLDDIIWSGHFIDRISALTNAALVADPEHWPTLTWTKQIVDKARDDLDIDWLEAPLTDEERARSSAALNPTYDMDTLDPKEPK